MHSYFATCPKGLEQLLFDELLTFGALEVKQSVAGVSFKGNLEIGYRAALWTRFSSRVLLKLADFPAKTDLELYLGVFNLSWELYFSSTKTLSVDFTGTSESIKNTLYGAQKVKDAIVDRFTKKTGARPSVDKESPDVRIVVHLDRKEKATVNIDITGCALHKRNYRNAAGAAPLKENLAAAIVTRANPNGNVIDPMCGSGTLLLEALMIATDTAPGLLREKIGFSNLSLHDSDLWEKLLNEAKVRSRNGKQKLLEQNIKYFGFDQDSRVIEIAKQNANNAGFSDFIEFTNTPLSELQKPECCTTPTIITNPPYGERLGNFTELLDLYSLLGTKLKQCFRGTKVAVISSSGDLLSCLKLRATKTYKLFNGALECQLKLFEINENPTFESRDVGVVAEEFANRLKKNIKNIRKWIESEGVDSYRIYDADLPNYNAAIDVYKNYAVIQEYAPPKSISPKVAHERILDMIQVTRNILEFPGDNIILKVREKQKGNDQYEKISETEDTFTVNEYGAKYIVNLRDYLDTGVFNDHRLVRKQIRKLANGKDFLNLFAYTGTATVQAAIGGAKSTTTVDMSKTYINWAKENLRINNIKNRDNQHNFIQADCLKWLEQATESYDLIFVDPPTFSNSKRMEATFDVQRDHIMLLTNLKKLLRPNGILIFSNNLKNFILNYDEVSKLGFSIKDLSKETLSKDYIKASALHNCWQLTLKSCE